MIKIQGEDYKGKKKTDYLGLTKTRQDIHDLLSVKVIEEENIQEKVSQKVKDQAKEKQKWQYYHCGR